MTVYPLVFDLGPLRITGYGIMMMVGFLVGGWVIRQRLLERGMNEEYGWDIMVAAVIGGIVGAKIWYVALTGDPGALLSRGGLVWYGGFLGGTAAVALNGLSKRVPTRLTLDLTAPALAIGYALGRVGCFMVQDDYGVPTALPWGMRFPQGLPPSTAQRLNTDFGIAVPDGVQPFEVLAVHPTQLYEVAIMFAVFWALWKLRDHGRGHGWLFGAYLLFAATERFLIEFLRAKDDRFIGGFTVAQMTAIALAVIGAWMMSRWSKPDSLRIPDDSVVLQSPERAAG